MDLYVSFNPFVVDFPGIQKMNVENISQYLPDFTNVRNSILIFISNFVHLILVFLSFDLVKSLQVAG